MNRCPTAFAVSPGFGRRSSLRKGVIAQLPIGPFASRPRLVGAMLATSLCALALAILPTPLASSSRVILSWDAGCLWFIVASLVAMSGKDGSDIRARAAEQDDGRGMILGLVLLATAASLGASGVELSLAKSDHGAWKTMRVCLAFLTVAASWFVAQLIFALHYAHEYYTAAPGRSAPAIRGGLNFPEGGEPDYWDFLHFSVIIGVASQTADISFGSRTLRRVGTLHSLLAYAFNTIVVALTINLWAGIF
jgi:uncharacterized membrane protein